MGQSSLLTLVMNKQVPVIAAGFRKIFLRRVSRHPRGAGDADERRSVRDAGGGRYSRCLPDTRLFELIYFVLGVGTATFKLTLRPRAQCHLRDST
jgi:hypothetical protein